MTIFNSTQSAIDDHIACIADTVHFLKHHTPFLPQIGLISGTGLSDSARRLEVAASFDYADIPHFPVSTVESHRGKLVFGKLNGKPAVVMQGRFHLYEGYSPLEVIFPIRVMNRLGVDTLILSNASGGLNSRLCAGDILMIRDHINLTGANALIGAHRDVLGDRFPDMSQAYSADLRADLRQSAEKLKIPLKEGVYAGLKGPSLETPAEVRFLKTIGADAVGFSTVLETIAAVQAGMRVLGISVVTNVHDPDNPQKSVIKDIIDVAGKASEKVEALITGMIWLSR
ncbi:MAG: purine-nucleoside phosphorylase [Desulfatirhabdiaceae bacterium]